MKSLRVKGKGKVGKYDVIAILTMEDRIIHQRELLEMFKGADLTLKVYEKKEGDCGLAEL